MDKTYPSQVETELFVGDLLQTENQNGVLDDTNDGVWRNAPKYVEQLSNVLGKQQLAQLLKKATSQFERYHGNKPNGGILEQTLRNTRNMFYKYDEESAVLDDALTVQSSAPLVANRAAVGILSGLVGDYMPHAGNIPMTDGAQGKIIVVSTQAATTTGAYKLGDDLTGVNAGKTLMSARRELKIESTGGGNYTFKTLYANDPSAGSDSPVQPHSFELCIAGFPVARTVSNSNNGATVSIVGSANVMNQEFKITGELTVVSGQGTVTITPEPNGLDVSGSVVLNFEHANMKGMLPAIQIAAKPFDFFAYPQSGTFHVTQNAKAQFLHEVRLDPHSEALSRLRHQASLERWNESLQALNKIGSNYIEVIDLNSSSRQNYRSRKDMWRDVLFVISQADVNMATRTNTSGIGVIYVGAKCAGELLALSDDLFKPSGLRHSNTIYRLGRLADKYEVYHVPNLVNETTNSVEMLVVGKSEQVALNPYIVGQVVAPTFLDLKTDNDLKEGAGYFSLGAGAVNPFSQAASGVGKVVVTGL